MDRNKFLAHLKKEIKELEGDNLQLASMFLYNWTEGPWTPEPLTAEQLAEIERRAEEIETGKAETIPMEEVWKGFEEKYGYVREKGEHYKAKREKEMKVELSEMLDHIRNEHLIQFDIFLKSWSEKKNWDTLSSKERKSIQRGIKDSKAGRVRDAFDFLRSNG